MLTPTRNKSLNLMNTTSNDPELMFTECLVLKRRGHQANMPLPVPLPRAQLLPLPSCLTEDRKLIEGWSIELDSQHHSLSMLHTLSRNIRSYEKMQRKLSERKNLRQLKEQYKNIRTTHTTRPQTSRRLKKLEKRSDVSVPLTDFTNESKNVLKQKSEIGVSLVKKHLKSNSRRVIEQMSQFDEMRETNQKRIGERRCKNKLGQPQETINPKFKPLANIPNPNPKILHQNQLSKNIRSLQQKLREILVTKRSTQAPVFDLVSLRELSKRENQKTESRASKQKTSRRTKSPMDNIEWSLNDQEFEDTKIFNRLR